MVETLRSYHQLINTELVALTESRSCAGVREPIQYALLSEGKRIRPLLALLVADMLGGSVEATLPVACAVELVHTASLILDDLPCMDDARNRRNQPSCHLIFGEDKAILASCQLLSLAYSTVSSHYLPQNPSICRDLLAGLGEVVGGHGLIGGQLADLASSSKSPSYNVLTSVYDRKTSRLFEYAASAAACVSGANPQERAAIETLASHLGMAFQFRDDLLDLRCGFEASAKDTGKDQGKCTFTTLTSYANTETGAELLITFALSQLSIFGSRSSLLREVVLNWFSKSKDGLIAS